MIAMTNTTAATLTLVLSLIAAGLALSAACVTYARTGEVNLALIGGGLFVLVFGLGARSRMQAK
jgi:hypothetical protein